jgi:chemotaxis protein methyltransferase WspC
VTFQIGNLLDPALLLFERPYDIVFCRNLFIYLTPPARQQALRTLARLVAPGGLLCMGHAEPLDPDDARFSRTGPDGFFLYRRTLMTSPHPALPAPARAPAAPRPQVPRVETIAPRPKRESGAARPAEAKESFADLLGRARSQADAGQLSAALESCRSIQVRFGPTADLYSLLGVIHQAREDRPAAAQAFRKALYLAPDHREALTHLMLLCQQQGETSQAALLRKRLERLAAPGEER